MSTLPVEDPHPRRTVEVLGTPMSYVDTGSGAPVVFLHGNPTSSYLWRNVVPPVAALARCLAPDLVGMGRSGRPVSGEFTFAEHARHLDAWFDAVLPQEQVVLVVHDWGGGLGLDWAARHPDRVRGIALMETIVAPLEWQHWPPAAVGVFQGFRSAAGEQMVLDKNVFVELVLPASVLRGLSEQEMAVYRAPYAEPGESRRPTLTWPRELPFVGEGPQDVLERVQAYGAWLATSHVPKLFVDADPGSILVGPYRELVRSWPATRTVTVPGLHFVQEDSGPQIGAAVAQFVQELPELPG